MITTAIIEIPQGSQNQYEHGLATRPIPVDRVLYAAIHYSVNYRIIPETWRTTTTRLMLYRFTDPRPSIPESKSRYESWHVSYGR